MGGTDTSKFNSTMVYADVEQNQGFWTLRSSGLAVNGQTTGLQQSLDIVFDSGTSNAVFPRDITEVMLSSVMHLSPDPQGYLCPHFSGYQGKLERSRYIRHRLLGNRLPESCD